MLFKLESCMNMPEQNLDFINGIPLIKEHFYKMLNNEIIIAILRL